MARKCAADKGVRPTFLKGRLPRDARRDLRPLASSTKYQAANPEIAFGEGQVYVVVGPEPKDTTKTLSGKQNR